MTDKDRSALITDKLLRAKSTLAEADLLINNDYFNAAVNRIYYACFYAVSALLISKSINTRKHSGVIQMFGQHFVLTEIIKKESARFYTELFDMRRSGDYQDMFYFTEDDVAPLLSPAEQLVLEIEEIIIKQA